MRGCSVNVMFLVASKLRVVGMVLPPLWGGGERRKAERKRKWLQCWHPRNCIVLLTECVTSHQAMNTVSLVWPPSYPYSSPHTLPLCVCVCVCRGPLLSSHSVYITTWVTILVDCLPFWSCKPCHVPHLPIHLPVGLMIMWWCTMPPYIQPL